MSFTARATICVVALISILSIPRVLAYDDHTAHPALTQEIVKFYNLSYPNNPVTSEEAEWIIQGSINEDQWPRWINHFYDPINRVGWTGDKAGTVSAEVVRAVSGMGLSIESPASSIEWTNGYLLQATYSRYGDNRTWKRGLEYYADGNKEEGYRTLGHALHLLEDMSVPDHTRDDTHANLEDVTGDTGSPYEQYTTKWTRSTITTLDIPNQLKSEGKVPIGAFSITDHLINLAQYSNKYFFSKDTINDPKYALPKITREDGGFGYGVDEYGKEFLIAGIIKGRNSENEETKKYVLEELDRYHPILDAYFSHLSQQAVLHGADVIKLFKKQAEDEVVNKEIPQHIVQVDADVVGRIFPNISLAAELKGISGRVSGWVGSITSGITEVGSAITNSVGGAFSSFTNLFKTNSGADVVGALTSPSPSGLDSRLPFAPAQDLRRGNDTNGGNGSDNGSEGDEGAKGAGEPSIAGDASQNSDAAQSYDFGTLQKQLNDAAKAWETVQRTAQERLNNRANTASAPQSPEPIFVAAPLVQIAQTFLGGGNFANSGYSGGGVSAGGVSAAPAMATNVDDTTNRSDRTNGTDTTNTTDTSNTTNTSDTADTTTASSTADTASSTPSTPSPPVVSLPNPLATHIVISELQVAGLTDAGDEFIELYNPTEQAVDLSEWSIQYVSGRATSTQSVARKNFNATSTIPAKGYFLIARGKNGSNADGYFGSKTADLSHRTFSLSGLESGGAVFLVNARADIESASDVHIVDRVAYGTGPENATGFAESSPASLPSAGESVARKAVVSSACATLLASGKFSGNGCDTDVNNSDFEILSSPDPQNNASLPEPRTAPAPQNALASFVSSTMRITFGWDWSEDARGATSTNLYRLYQLPQTNADGTQTNADATTTLIGATTSSRQFSFSITEVGRDYSFDFEVEDRDGLANRATSTLAVSSFLSRAYFYPDTRGGDKNLFDMFYTSRPFIPPVRSASSYGSPPWQAVVLYLNRMPNASNRYLDTDNAWNPEDTSGVLSIKIKNSSKQSAVFGLTANRSNGIGGGLNNSSFLLPTEDGHLTLTIYPHASSTSDYLTIGYYDFCNSGGGHQTLCFVAADQIHYEYLSSRPAQESPTAPTITSSTFSEASGALTIKFTSSTDADTPNSSITYEINYTTSSALDAGGWRSAGTNFTYSFTPAFPQSPYLIGVRAKDDFGNLSAVATFTWSFPEGYSPPVPE